MKCVVLYNKHADLLSPQPDAHQVKPYGVAVICGNCSGVRKPQLTAMRLRPSRHKVQLTLCQNTVLICFRLDAKRQP